MGKLDAAGAGASAVFCNICFFFAGSAPQIKFYKELEAPHPSGPRIAAMSQRPEPGVWCRTTTARLKRPCSTRLSRRARALPGVRTGFERDRENRASSRAEALRPDVPRPHSCPGEDGSPVDPARRPGAAATRTCRSSCSPSKGDDVDRIRSASKVGEDDLPLAKPFNPARARRGRYPGRCCAGARPRSPRRPCGRARNMQSRIRRIPAQPSRDAPTSQNRPEERPAPTR